MSFSKIFLLKMLFLTVIFCNAQKDSNKNIYSGGMLIYQTASVSAENPHSEFSVPCSGIGGILRFYPGKFFATGIYGGTLKGNYSTANSDNSYIYLSYGGVFGGITYKGNHFRYTFSAFAGFGKIRNLHIEEQLGSQLVESYLYNRSTFLYAPLFSVDYLLSQRLLITSQFTYFIADNNRYQGPALQIGALINR